MVFQKGNQLGKHNLGKKHSPETIRKLVAAAKLKDKSSYINPERNRKISESRIGEKHPLWAGDKVSYAALHSWVKRHLVKAGQCAKCHEIKPLDLANKSGKYLRDLTDWEWLCRRCHMIKDGVLEKMQKAHPDLRGDKSPLWKGGLPKCISCNKSLGNYIATRCRKCYLELKVRGRRQIS